MRKSVAAPDFHGKEDYLVASRKSEGQVSTGADSEFPILGDRPLLAKGEKKLKAG